MHTEKEETQDLFLPLPTKQPHTWSIQTNFSTRRRGRGISLEASVILEPFAVTHRQQRMECSPSAVPTGTNVPVKHCLCSLCCSTGLGEPLLLLGQLYSLPWEKLKQTQWERYGTLGTKNGKFLQDHRKRSHCTDVFQFKRSREQESKAGERQTSPEKAHLSADHTSPSNFSISRIHFSKACNFSPFCQQLQLQKSFGLGKAHSYWNHGIISHVRHVLICCLCNRLLRAWELALLMWKQGGQGPEAPQRTDLPPAGARREGTSVTGTRNFNSPCP